MDDHTRLERLLADGYLLVGYVLPLSKLSPESIGKAVSVFSIQLAPKILLDPSNRAKSLVMLRHPSTGQRVEILTLDERTIRRANEQLRYQEEPIGTLIRARCAAVGGSSPHRQIFHLDRLVASLDGRWGWEFKLGNIVGTFEVIIRLESTGEGAAQEVLDKLRLLLDCLAVSQQVGFRIEHWSVTSIPRSGLSVSWGPEEMMLLPLTPEQIDNIEADLSSTEARTAARGLNEAYVETFMPNRHSRFWAAAEQVFGGKPEPLLTDEEVKGLLGAAEPIESLANAPDRLKKLEEALSDPNRLPLVTRNERMADAIASIRGISKEEAYREVRAASELRGKHGHQLLANSENFEASAKFLHEALWCYLKRQKAS
jgi:hypothetical protein